MGKNKKTRKLKKKNNTSKGNKKKFIRESKQVVDNRGNMLEK